MANISRHLLTVTSDPLVAQNTRVVRTGGEAMNIQFLTNPAAIQTLQVSADGVTWAVAEDNSGVPIANLGAAVRNVATLAEYTRFQVAALQPNNFAGVLTVRKEIT